MLFKNREDDSQKTTSAEERGDIENNLSNPIQSTWTQKNEVSKGS